MTYLAEKRKCGRQFIMHFVKNNVLEFNKLSFGFYDLRLSKTNAQQHTSFHIRVVWRRQFSIRIFIRLRAVWPNGYQRGTPERRLLKNKQCEKVVFPKESNLQPLMTLS